MCKYYVSGVKVLCKWCKWFKCYVTGVGAMQVV